MHRESKVRPPREVEAGVSAGSTLPGSSLAPAAGVDPLEALEARAGRELDRLEALLATAPPAPAEVEAAWQLTVMAASRIEDGRPAAAQAARALGAWRRLIGAGAFASAAPLLVGRLVLAVEAGFEAVARRLADKENS